MIDRKRVDVVVLELLKIHGLAPEMIDLPTKWVLVSGASEHLSEPGSCKIKPAQVRADLAQHVSV